MPIRKIRNNLPLALYAFLIIYTPAIGPAPSLAKYIFLMGGPFFAIFYLTAVRSPLPGILLGNKFFASAIYFSILASLYVAEARLFGPEQISSLAETRIIQNNTFTLMGINAILLISMLRQRGFNENDSFDLLVFLGGFQGIFSIAGAVSPTIKSISNALYIADGGTNQFVMTARVYGFSTDFTYGTPIYHGTLAALAFCMALVGKKRYWIPTILLLATTALNGRTGLIVFTAIVACFLARKLIKRGGFIQVLTVIISLLTAAWLFLKLLENYIPNSHRFVKTFLEQTWALLAERKLEGNYAILAEGIATRPHGWHFIFGEGVYVYDKFAGFRTDVGVTIDLFSGGILAVLVVYISFFIFILRTPGPSSLITLSVIIMWFFSNIKGDFFRSSILLFLACFLVINFSSKSTSHQTEYNFGDSPDRSKRNSPRILGTPTQN